MDKNFIPLICDQWLQTSTYLKKAYWHIQYLQIFILHYTTVCLYQLLKENCVNDAELQFNVLQNFEYCLENYRLCSQMFFSWTKLWRNLTLCSSELSLDTPWNFTHTFERSFIEKSRVTGTKNEIHISKKLLDDKWDDKTNFVVLKFVSHYFGSPSDCIPKFG